VKNIVYIAQSLDGYIAGPVGEIDWLEDIDNPNESDLGFSAFMNTIDALVMGRNTFEKVASFDFWPYEKPVYVVSKKLSTIPDRFAGKAFLIKDKPKEIISTLNTKSLCNLYIDGGLLIQSFLIENLIDEIIVSTLPVILGGGIPLFSTLSNKIKLKLESSEVLINQLVQTHYRVIKA